MTYPVRATTGDPRFDPREPVLVNGYRYEPTWMEPVRALCGKCHGFGQKSGCIACDGTGFDTSDQLNTGGRHELDPTQHAGSAPGGAKLDPEYLPGAVSGDQEQ
jgi:hypothetical protein